MAYRMRLAKPFSAEFRSVAKNQLSHAIQLLEEQPDGPHQSIHGARKRFKRVRALYRLIQPNAREFRAAENTRIRDMAKTLAAVREATALVETVDYLAEHAASPEEFAALTVASKSLTDRRDRIASEEHDLPAKVSAAVETCHAAIAALDELDLDDLPHKTARRLAKVWKKQRLKALAALAGCEEHADAEVFHELRKSGQTYWMHLSLLRDIWPSAMRAKQAEAKLLVDLLGHEHDLSVLTELIDENPKLLGDGDTLALILGAIINRQQALRIEALDKAHEVFADRADNEAEMIALLWKRAAATPRKQRKPLKANKAELEPEQDETLIG